MVYALKLMVGLLLALLLVPAAAADGPTVTTEGTDPAAWVVGYASSTGQCGSSCGAFVVTVGAEANGESYQLADVGANALQGGNTHRDLEVSATVVMLPTLAVRLEAVSFVSPSVIIFPEAHVGVGTGRGADYQEIAGTGI